jgi:HAD superfamily hydrolase (TIGR01662 family)
MSGLDPRPAGPPTIEAADVDIVVPTIGRATLRPLLDAVAGRGSRVVVVDDRADRFQRLDVPPGVEVLAGGARGPAAARNTGWRSSSAAWVAFVDDDVTVDARWHNDLRADLAAADLGVGGSQGQVSVPLPTHRRPTDFERDVAGLASAEWITADMAYRVAALAAVGGFDERFPRAYREDADLAARVRAAGWTLARGSRRVTHAVPASDPWVSVRRQAGNADDALLRAVHGRHWRELTGVRKGRRGRHLAITAAGLAAVALAGSRSHRRLAALAAAGWLAGTAEFTWTRIAPGPATAAEVATMVATSCAIPPVATWHWLAGWARLPARLRRGGPAPAAVLFDRDGTLVVDVPYNGDPDLVVPMPGARRALRRLRAAGIPTAVISNQSGIGRGLLAPAQVDAVNRRVEQLLGPLGPWLICPHQAEDGCQCRKPASGLVEAAAAALQVAPSQVAVIGDIGADIDAARAVGARGILVPTAATRPEEVARAPEVAADLDGAVRLLLGGR